jgi:integrase
VKRRDFITLSGAAVAWPLSARAQQRATKPRIAIFHPAIPTLDGDREEATMILIGYRHGLRASELCDLQWSQVELATGRLHVRRAKNGSPSVHPMQGDEIRALRRLQREQGASSHVFMTERDGPMTPKVFQMTYRIFRTIR